MTHREKLLRKNSELAVFLKSRRERISPAEKGLPNGNRRKTRGLRREEVAILAGVGLSWYTWLEQGRDISVSSNFLDRLAEALRLTPLEREHLFFLAQKRPPEEEGIIDEVLPEIIQDLMDDLPFRPCYVLNLRWDILGWNSAADAIFKFSDWRKDELNFIWLLFTKPYMRSLITNWNMQANNILSSFRRDYVKIFDNIDANLFINCLKDKSKVFSELWERQDIHVACEGLRDIEIPSIGTIKFKHKTLIINNKTNLKFTYYKAMNYCEQFNAWVIEQSRGFEQTTHDIYEKS